MYKKEKHRVLFYRQTNVECVSATITIVVKIATKRVQGEVNRDVRPFLANMFDDQVSILNTREEFVINSTSSTT